MSLYHTLFGTHGNAGPALALIGKTREDFLRYRDAWIETDDTGTPRVAVYTRTGGGNREHALTAPCGPPVGPARTDNGRLCWGCWVDSVADWPGYLHADDDQFDRTYRTFYFAIPPQYADDVARLAESGMVTPYPVDMGDRWKAMIGSLGEETP